MTAKKQPKYLTEDQKEDMRRRHYARYNNDPEYKELQRRKSGVHAKSIAILIKKYKEEFKKIKLKETKNEFHQK